MTTGNTNPSKRGRYLGPGGKPPYRNKDRWRHPKKSGCPLSALILLAVLATPIVTVWALWPAS